MIGKLLLVVQPQDIEPVIPFGSVAPNSAGGGLGRGFRARSVTGAAIHFIGNRQNNVIGCQRLVQAVSHGDQDVSVETTENLSSPDWQAAGGAQSTTNGITTTIRIPVTTQSRFFRLRTAN